MDRPRDLSEFTIRFVCAAVSFGFVAALIGLRFIDSFSSGAVAVWALVTSGLSLIAALRGDEAWGSLANFFRWW